MEGIWQKFKPCFILSLQEKENGQKWKQCSKQKNSKKSGLILTITSFETRFV